jgi:hypothetical protein
MGTDSLPKLAAAPAKVAATTTQYNLVVDALQGHEVMRDSSGDIEDNVNDIGRPSSGRPRRLYLGTGLNVAGQEIDFSSISLQVSGVISGKSKTSGYPDFLTPEGVTGGATNTFVIEASTTNLEVTIDGGSYTLETDLVSDDLALAPSTNNTCTVDDDAFTGDPEWTKTTGEYGYWISLTTTGGGVGSEITSLDGTIQCFKLENAATGEGPEIFIAKVDTTNDRLIPIKRGIGDTDRITYSNTDTITLLKAHYIFLDNDLSTIDTTTNHPVWAASAPSAPATGDYWKKVADGKWYRYSGSAWEALGRIYLGYAICDETDCLWVEHDDYNLAWDDTLDYASIRIKQSGSNIIKINAPLKLSVAGNNDMQVLSSDIEIDFGVAGNYESGEAQTIDTWYYLYCDNLGNLYLSTKAPRRPGFKKGFYHPREYWRAISAILTDSTPATLIPFYYNSIIGKLALDVTEVQATGTYSSTASELMTINCPPMVNSIDIITRTSAADQYGYFQQLEGGGILTVGFSPDEAYYSTSNFNFIENSLFFLQLDVSPNSDSINLASFYLKF